MSTMLQTCYVLQLYGIRQMVYHIGNHLPYNIRPAFRVTNKTPRFDDRIVPPSHTQKKVKDYYIGPILSHKPGVSFLKTKEVQQVNNFSPHIHWPHAEIWSEFNSPNVY